MTDQEVRRGAKGAFAPALEAILEKVSDARQGGGLPIVIFDLDDTLLSTHNRHLRILKEFAAQARPEDAADARRLAGVRREQLKNSITATAIKAGVRDEALLARLRDFWFERFFRNDYLAEDAPIAGAPEFVRAVLFARGVVVYLTGRDEAMRPGTLSALEKWDFAMPHRMPWRDRVRLLMKPVFDAEDLNFKVETVARLAAEGEVLAVFENDPAYLKAMLEGVPGMTPVLAVPQFLLR